MNRDLGLTKFGNFEIKLELYDKLASNLNNDICKMWRRGFN